jgi:ribonuclease E
MARRMLIDAAHPEEVRVAILNGNRLEEFDFETAVKRQIKGNIYLAKVTRVEPSLQAAFVEYGGNRHGFLAFNEIHPDYYRIPVGDRAAFQSIYESRGGGTGESTGEEAEQAPPSVEAGDAEPRPAELPEANESFSRAIVPEESAADAPADQPDESEETVPGEHPAAQPAQSGDDIIYDKQRPTTDESGTVANAEMRSPDTVEETAPYHGGEDRMAQGGASPEAAETISFGPPANDDLAAMPPLDSLPPEERDAETPRLGPETLETLGGEEEEEEEEIEEAEAPRPRFRSHRHYKIQEVIKRRQIMLVQVTKEERGNKGAALTTYLSLAGRYCVLMPNTPRGGGVSRKITAMADRRRLKDLMSDLEVPEGMGVIVRTAGSERSKTEIKRDFEYLLRLWDEIRDLTLKSTAPALVYEEGNLIKRSIRDLYTRDVEEIIVDGEEGYKAAKAFMKMLMPSHAKRVKLYRDPTVPLFHRYQVEAQIDAIHSPIVQLRSGGYLVINPTEALVAIDVNSGRATRERNIEETALKTNLEAAEEVARQLRLRDLAGLIVVDFIDMEETRNAIQVERRIKDAMRHDRARIQIGRISAFGLLELSRQRLRPSILEASTEPCPHCGGTGHIRSTESTALHILRAIEEEGMRRRSAEVGVAVPTQIALYLLNQKRAALTQAEHRYGFAVTIGRDDSLIPPAFRLDRLRALSAEEIAALPPPPPPLIVEEEEAAAEEDEDLGAEETGRDTSVPRPGTPPVFEVAEEEDAEVNAAPKVGAQQEDGRRGHGRRRRRHGDERRRAASPARPETTVAIAPSDAVATEDTSEEVEALAEPAAHPATGEEAGGIHKRRRRGRRGGRRRRREHSDENGLASPADEIADEMGGEEIAELAATEPLPRMDESGPGMIEPAPEHELPPAPEVDEPEVARPKNPTVTDTAPAAEAVASERPPAPEAGEAEVAQPEPPTVAVVAPSPEPVSPHPLPTSEPAPEPEPVRAGPPRRGWWHRR